jgi:transposase IS116/IS110/IS902 family protein
MVQMKNKISGLLMEAGVSYNKQRLHRAGYFRELLATNSGIDEGLCSLLRLCRETVVRLQKTESAMVLSLERDSLLMDRVERLMTIPAVGPITALTWALEVGDAQRFSSIKKAISYCGLCGAEKSSANTVQRTPLSKQRNKHLQTTLIEAAKMAPRYSPNLAMLYDKEKQKRQCQSCHAGGGTEAGGLPHGDRPWSAEFSGGGNELHRCVKRGGEQGGFLRRVACQVLPSSRLGEGAQALDALVDKFRDWQETQTQSSVQLKG